MSGRISAATCAIIALALVATGAWSCGNSTYSGPPEPITIGTPPLESSALIYVAQDQGFFADNGLIVTLRDYETGAASLNGLLKEEVHIATPAEYALVGKAMQKENVRAIASIDKVQYFFLVGRKDRGVENISSLRGKRIGVVRKTTAEFYLGRFLELHGMHPEEVDMVDTSISQSVEAIINGSLDAIVSRPPYVHSIEKQLGATGVTWPVQSSQALYAILIGRNNWISEHSELVDRLLKSLAQAEQFLIKRPEEAKAIVQKRLNFDDAYMATVWSQNQFSLTLDQSLIAAMEDEARWMISNSLTTETQVPDFSEYIYADSLEKLMPGAVSIIR